MVKFASIILLGWSVNVDAADSIWDYIVGLSIKEVTLDVYDEGDADSLGTLAEGFRLYPEFGLESGINYFSNSSSWGYKYALNLSGFDLSRQEVGLDEEDLDTSADGYFFYAMPVALYDFHKNRADSSLLIGIGIGIGIGYLNAEGDIILTEASPQTRQEFSFSKSTWSAGVFFQYIIDGWSFSTSAAGPEVRDGDFDYSLFDFTLSVRRTFPL